MEFLISLFFSHSGMNYEFVPLKQKVSQLSMILSHSSPLSHFPSFWINFTDTLKSSLILLQIYGMKVKIERKGRGWRTEKEEIQDDLRDAKNDFPLFL